jgi:DNA-binding MarR family transcriptional regulator
MKAELRDELRQNKPFRSLNEEASLNIVRTGSVLMGWFEQVLKPFGITGAQYNVLRILHGSPDGLCRNEIRDRMVTRMPDMTRMLDRMEEGGLVVRERETGDRRIVNTQVTAKGRRLLEKLEGLVVQELQHRFGHLSDSQLRSLVSMLTSIRQTE